MGCECPVPERARLRIKELFRYTPEVETEYTRAFGARPPWITLPQLGLFYDANTREAWIRFSVSKAELASNGVSVRVLKARMRPSRCDFKAVQPDAVELHSFESRQAKQVQVYESPWVALHGDIRALNLVTSLRAAGVLSYQFTKQEHRFKLPQLVVSYSLLFWLGSLVRYDPYSLSHLMDSKYWILIDGFMSQSRLWLLELFRWALYRTETTLSLSRLFLPKIVAPFA